MGKVLRLDLAGTPTSWLSYEDAVILYIKGLVKWEIGTQNVNILGGIKRINGKQSQLKLSPVIATQGNIYTSRESKNVNNPMLFKRDNFRCMYCGFKFTYSELTCDHVIPKSKGGPDTWENIVAACKRCNNVKADRTPEEAGMELLALPFRPNIFESMFLAQHKVLHDQMEYLEKQFSGHRDWKAA